jgi:hypothetical protein
MALSRAWAVKKTQRGIYTGGKVRSTTRAGNSRRSLATHFPPSSILSTPKQVALLVPPPPLGEEVGAEAAGEDELVVTMYGSDVILSNVKNGQVVAIISCGEGEVRLWCLLVFACLAPLSLVPTTTIHTHASKPGVDAFLHRMPRSNRVARQNPQ